MPFNRLLDNVIRVKSELNDIIVGAMIENKAEIIDLNTSQLEEGKLSTGSNITPEYQSDDYKKFKKSIGSKSPFGVPDLKLEGDFYSGFDIIKGSGGAFIHSDDTKAGDLEEKYSSNIYGITDKNKPEVVERILPQIQNEVKNELTR